MSTSRKEAEGLREKAKLAAGSRAKAGKKFKELNIAAIDA
jgi:hypothetical protein